VVASTYLSVIPNLTRSASPYVVIENVIVEESQRGTGLGKQVIRARIDICECLKPIAHRKEGYLIARTTRQA
jgi:predicted GNAT family N-acyltransferase